MTSEAATQQACSLHKTHQPKPLVIEWHHLIPVGWQLHTACIQPPPSPGEDPDGRGMLWDNRGIWACPTGHRNIHAWIVALMHKQAELGTGPQAAYDAIKPRIPPAELPVALEALTRWQTETGLPFLDLTVIGEWGQSLPPPP